MSSWTARILGALSWWILNVWFGDDAGDEQRSGDLLALRAVLERLEMGLVNGVDRRI